MSRRRQRCRETGVGSGGAAVPLAGAGYRLAESTSSASSSSLKAFLPR